MNQEVLSEKEARRSEIYEPFRTILDQFETGVLEKPVEQMWFSAMLQLRRVQKDVNGGEILLPEIIGFWNTFGKPIVNVLALETQLVPDIKQDKPVTQARRVIQAIHRVSTVIDTDRNTEIDPQKILYLDFDELLKMSDRFRTKTELDEEGNQRRYFSIYSSKKDAWFEYPIPKTDKVLHKGGLGRTMLKILFGSDLKLVESELPAHDFDYIAVKCPEAEEDLRGLKADFGGVEEVDALCLDTLMNNRDLTLNNAFVGNRGLIYAESALEATKKGKIDIVATKRGIYGSEIFFHQGVRLIKNRGMMRLLKTLAEEKAVSFDFLPLNEQIDLGIYWLILARRFANRSNFPLLMDRLFELSRQIGQIHEGEEDVYDVLDRVHQKYPFYNFDDSPIDEEGVARWLGRKLMKQVDKKYRDEYEVPSLLNLDRRNGDTISHEVSLRNYQPDLEKLEKIKTGWKAYISRCRRRTVEHLEELSNDIGEEI